VAPPADLSCGTLADPPAGGVPAASQHGAIFAIPIAIWTGEG